MCRYFVGLLVPDPIQELVFNLNTQFNLELGTPLANSSPHITLSPPFDLDENEAILLGNVLESVAARVKPFFVDVHSVGGFIQPKVVFLEVRKTKPLIDLKTVLNNVAISLGLPKDRYSFNPHITIASKALNEETRRQAFNKAVAAFSADSFMATELTLFVKHDDIWSVAYKFPFVNR